MLRQVAGGDIGKTLAAKQLQGSSNDLVFTVDTRHGQFLTGTVR